MTEKEAVVVQEELAVAERAYRNRIVGYGEESPDQLLANPYNFRVHPIEQAEALRGLLERVGWVQSVVKNTVTGHLVDGHLRVMDAMRANEPMLPVTYVELSEAEERLVLSVFDRLAAMAVPDEQKLKELLERVSDENDVVGDELDELLEKMMSEVDFFDEDKEDDEEKDLGAGEVIGDYVEFVLGNYKGKVGRDVYESFESAYLEKKREGDHLIMLDDVIKDWLNI
jgi:hypothetical protein